MPYMDASDVVGVVFLLVGALLVLAEIHTLTVYLLAVAAGLFAAGGLALTGASLTADLSLLAVVVVLALPLAHWWRKKLKNHAAEVLMNDDVGRSVVVVDVADGRLRVSYRGSTWSAQLDAAALAAPQVGEHYRIVRREGNLLYIAPSAVQPVSP